jgi:hypothetical protein
LIVALAAFLPMRLKNLAALDIDRHFKFDEDAITVAIESTETKTGVPIEFEIPALIKPYLLDYCRLVRPQINPTTNCTALWVFKRGPESGSIRSHTVFQFIFRKHFGQRLGMRVTPHDVRSAAATTWGIFSPDRIGVAKELANAQRQPHDNQVLQSSQGNPGESYIFKSTEKDQGSVESEAAKYVQMSMKLRVVQN